MADSTNNQTSEKANLKDFAFGTQVATPSGAASIEKMQVGDPVLAFSARLESGKIILSSKDAKVLYSAGSNNYHITANMIYIDLNNDTRGGIICSPDQPFLLSNGKYARAQNLYPGQSLVDKDGNAVEIALVSIGQYIGGIHGIATDTPGLGPDGHLLLCNGVVMGDYAFQIGFNSLSQDLKEIS